MKMPINILESAVGKCPGMIIENNERFGVIEELINHGEGKSAIKNYSSQDFLNSTSDVMRLYLKEMGSVSLLSRQKEIEIAKRIEQGKEKTISALIGIPMAIMELISLGKRLKRHEIDIKEVVFYLEEEFEEDEERNYEGLRIRTIHLLSGLKSIYKKYIKVPEKINKSKRISTKIRFRNNMISLNKEMIVMIEEMNLKPTLLNIIVKKLNALLKVIDYAESDITYCCSKLSMKENELSSFFNKLEAEKLMLMNFRFTHCEIEELEIIFNSAKKKIDEVESELKASANELRQAMKDIDEGKYRTKTAKTELIEANLRYVVSMAKKYFNKGLHYLDLIQEGNLGLMKAADKFDYKKGYKFITYATWCIRREMIKAIAEHGSAIRLPVHVKLQINQLLMASIQLTQELGREPNEKEIAEKINMPVDKVREILKTAIEPISLETPIGTDEDMHLGDLIEDNTVISPIDAVIKNEFKLQINNALQTLSPREEKVLRKRFGVGESKDHTLEEVGLEFNLSRERIRQIEDMALSRLRRPVRNGNLKCYLELK